VSDWEHRYRRKAAQTIRFAKRLEASELERDALAARVKELEARTCSHGDYKVWGTDACDSCQGGRVTLYYLGEGVCTSCENQALRGDGGRG
jgi:hypothetical protein